MPLVAALCTALVVPTALAAPASAATGGGLGKPALPAQRHATVHAVTSLGATKARAQVAAEAAANRTQSQRALQEQKAAWPKAGQAASSIPGSGRAKLTVGGLPVTVGRSGKQGSASGTAQVKLLSRKQASAAGVNGLLLTTTADRAGTADVGVDYSAFASAYGGGWSGRLHLVQLPACALTTPQKSACRVQTALGSHNDIGAQTVSANVALAPTGIASATVLALAATSGESASGSGNYAATPLSSASTWQAGGSSGAFTWNEDLSTPPAAAGPSPSLSLSYDSGSVDGNTASTNNQSTQVGEGFDLTSSSYIARSYASCDNDGQVGKYDLCWKYDNASLVLNGKSTELVKNDTTGTWRLKNDDASTVTHSTGADNGDEGDSNIDGAGEYWTVTTGDGTQYVFGLNKLPGAGTERTNSVWTTPVFGDDSGEPGYSSGTTFSGRSKNQAWRWNLDYVVDPHGNAMSYWYTAESNYYAKNGATTGTAQYTRGGYLTKILYGQRSDTLFTATAAEKVDFTYDERCTASDCSSLTSTTANNWPDVPYDSICTSGGDCNAPSPSFFTRKRLTQIDTSAYSTATSAYLPVDSWALKQEFLDPGDLSDSSDQTMVLDSIQHTGKTGTAAIKLDPVTFTYQMRANRVDSSTDNILPLHQPRISSVTSETGAITSVTLSDPECVRGSNMPASEDNDTKSCYPQYWHINGATEATVDWFNKYRVLAVVTSDPTGLGQTMENQYSYADPAWHYNNDPLTPADERTWSQWRGYGKVTATKGATTATQSKTVTLYLQGMDGDKQSNGTTRSATVAGIDFPNLDVADQSDSDQYAGFTREQITYNGSTPVAVTVNDPWSSQTASQQKSYANITAYYVNTAKTSTNTYLPLTGTWRTRTTSTTYDSYGMPEAVFDAGDTSVTGDETCTRTWYARNTAVGITSLVSRTRTVGRACTTADTSMTLPTSTATRGDVLSDTAAVYDDTTATVWTASQTPTRGDASWTGRATAYPATANSSGERNPTSWQTVTKATYDTLGRALSATDAGGNTATTAYTPVASGPLTRTIVTNPKGQKTTSFIDPARGSALQVFDANTKLTESTYDALGRVTAVWLPNRSKGGGQSANYTYAYSVTSSGRSWTSTSTIRGDGVYNTTYTIYDSLLRTLQTQSLDPNGGRVLTDTRYDSRGLAYETYAEASDSSAPSSTYARVEYGGAPNQTDTVFDGAERATTSTLYVGGVKKWSTTTSYTGDSIATTAQAGGSATRTITDVFGRTTERREYSGTSPADTGYGAGAGVGAAYTTTKFKYTRDGLSDTVTGPDGAQWGYSYDLFGRQISATDPDKGTTTTHYTDLDQVDYTTDWRGTLLYGYDTLGRKTDQWQTSKADANKLAHFDYDTLAKGQLDDSISYVGGTTGTAYTRKVTAYDSLYRATTTQLLLPATDPLVTSGAVASTLSVSAAYNLDGTQQNTSEPAAAGLSAEIITTGHDAVGLPTTVQGSSGYLLGASYTDLGQTLQLTLGTSAAAGTLKAYITNDYEAGTDRLKQSTVTDQASAYRLQDLNYSYDDAGNVTAINDTSTPGGTGKPDNQCFTYDGYRRLTNAWTPTTADCSTTPTTATLGGASPYWTSYTYKDSGLRSTETTHTTSATTTKTYCYNSTTQPHALTATTTASSCTGVPAAYVYDPTGNTTTRPDGTSTQSLTWTPQGDLNTVTEKSSTGTTTSTTSHIYDANGTLLIRRNTSGETVLYLDGTTEVHLNTTTSTAKYWAQRYYTAAGTTIAVRSNKTGTNTLSWLAADQHGTSSLSLDATTQAVTKRYTTPFGAPRTGSTGTWPDDKTFLGKTTDTTSGLTYIGAREYDPTTGRFISVDPLLDTGNAQSLNGYTYADNNPTTTSDPTGMCADIDCPTRPCPECQNTTPGQKPGPVKPTANASASTGNTGGTASTNSTGNTSGGSTTDTPTDAGYYNGYSGGYPAAPGLGRGCDSTWTCTVVYSIAASATVVVIAPLCAAMPEACASMALDEMVDITADAPVSITGKGGAGAKEGVKRLAAGFSADTASSAFQGMRNGGGHAMRHLIDDGIIPNKGSVAAKAQIFEEKLSPVLTSPSATFDWKLGGTMSRGFSGQVDGRTVVVFVAKEGPYQGSVISAVTPDAQGLAKWGLK
jgi:RHS repeat-associated protein